MSQVDAFHEDLGVVTQENQTPVQGVASNVEGQEDGEHVVDEHTYDDAHSDDYEDDDDYEQGQLFEDVDDTMFDMHTEHTIEGIETKNTREDESRT